MIPHFRSSNRQRVCSCLLSLCFVTAVAAADPLVVNPQSTTYDYYPSSATTPDGSVWISWHGYRNGRDQIFARRVTDQGEWKAVHTISQSGTVHGPPTILSRSDSAASVVWVSKLDGRWRVLLRPWRQGEWLPAIALSHAEHDAINATAIALVGGRTFVAWSEHRQGGFQVRGCLVSDGRQGETIPMSAADGDAFRPVLVSHGDQLWAIWDQYHQPNYSVHARSVFPDLGRVEHVSPPGQYCLKPTAVANSSGLWVAWLRKQDVIGGPGVISQLHTLHAARRDGDEWKLIETEDGQTVAAELTHGLMAKIDPKPVATGGYLGPRTRPMLLADGDHPWLLWERKSDHRGSTPTIAGDLVGRPIRSDRWGQAAVLSRGRVDYHVMDSRRSGGGELRLLASRLPVGGIRSYEIFPLDLDRRESFQQEKWTGWTAVDLPIQSELPPRRQITAGGKTYQLFWADLHCHNGLTADAEGEPDEMHHYARDRAALDVVVFTNNDFYNVPLTQYEFELGNLLAGIYSAKGEPAKSMLSLPGFEWTSRIPGSPDASLADPGNWLPPYKNRSYPNHRSVIYPPEGGPLIHFTEVGNNIDRLNEAVEKAGGITLSQHSAFQLSGHAVEVGMELTSGWSNYIASRPALFHTPLNQGARLGFTANGDTHRRAPGFSGALTGIYAESLTADAILDALRSRRCFATMGSRIFIDARANETLMGQETTAIDRSVDLTLHAIGTRRISAAVLIRDGKEIYRTSETLPQKRQGEGTAGNEFKAAFTDEGLSRGTHWYYWRVSQEQTAPVLPGNLMPAHGHLAWSTPNWVVVE